MSVKKPKVDFTSGNVFSKLLLFSLPIIATNVLQVLYNAADLMVISLSTEPNGVGAVGFSATPVGLIINLFIGFSLGSNVIIARNIGAKDKEGTERAIHTALTLALIFGIGSSILGLIVSRPLLIIMGAPEVLLDLAVTYMSIYFLGVPFVALTNFLISIFRAKGDSKTPLIVLSITGLVNVTLNLIFVLVFNLSAEGVALATAIANAVSCVVLLIKLRKCDDYTGFRFKKLCLNKRMARDILYVGFPSAIQGSFISITNMVITSSISVLDLKLSPDPLLTPVINGNAAQGNLDGFVYTAMDAITAGVISFTGQNFGAKQPDRIKRGVYWGTLQVSLVGLFSAILIYIFRAPLLSLYGVVTPNHYLVGISVAVVLINLDFLTVKVSVLIGIGIILIQSLEGHTVDRGKCRIAVCIHTRLEEVCKTVSVRIESHIDLFADLLIDACQFGSITRIAECGICAGSNGS